LKGFDMYLNTARVPWTRLRGAVSTDDTALAAFAYANWPTSGTLNLNAAPLQDASGLIVAFHGTDAENEDATFKLYGRVRANGPILLLCAGTITLGSQVCTLDPVDGVTAIANGKWADTIVLTAGDGIFADSITILDSADNRIALMQFDQKFIEDLYVEFDLDGGSSTSASMYAVITGY